MPEWLNGDPLNGLIMTITFFISIIIGKYIRKNGIFEKKMTIDTRIKILALFLLIISIMLMGHPYIPFMISIICILIAKKMNILMKFFQKLFFPALLASFILAARILTCESGWIECLLIPYSGGSGLLIFSRVMAAAALTILLVSTSSENEITGSIRWFGVPRTMLDISLLMNRYIKSFSGEAKKLEFAQKSRCGFSKKSGYRTKLHDISSIAGALINRASLRADMVHKAMISRGWKHGTDYPAEQTHFMKKDLIMLLIFSTGILILIGIDRMM